MRTKLFILLVLVSILLSACAPAAPTAAPAQPETIKETVVVRKHRSLKRSGGRRHPHRRSQSRCSLCGCRAGR